MRNEILALNWFRENNALSIVGFYLLTTKLNANSRGFRQNSTHYSSICPNTRAINVPSLSSRKFAPPQPYQYQTVLRKGITAPMSKLSRNTRTESTIPKILLLRVFWGQNNGFYPSICQNSRRLDVPSLLGQRSQTKFAFLNYSGKITLVYRAKIRLLPLFAINLIG